MSGIAGSARDALDRAVALAAPGAATSALLLRRWRTRAIDAGASEELVGHADELALESGVRSALAMLRLLVRVSHGETGAITPLLNKLGGQPDDCLMWDALRLAGYEVDGLDADSDPATVFAAVRPEIERAFAADGYSQAFEWLLTRGLVAPAVGPIDDLMRVSIDASIERRRSDLATLPAPTIDDLVAVWDALDGVIDDLTVWGPSLLLIEHPNSRFPLHGPLELATQHNLEQHRTQLMARVELVTDHADLWSVRTEDGAEATLVQLEDVDGRIRQRCGPFTRWHRPFDRAHIDARGRSLRVPTDRSRILFERFGADRFDVLFHDPYLDEPNTLLERDLNGLLHATYMLRSAIREADRFAIASWTETLRDEFGIDYSQHVPRPVHRKVLAASPVGADELSGRDPIAVVGTFETIDAALVRKLESLTGPDRFIVAIVRVPRLAAALDERVATANSLRSIDKALLAPDDSALPSGVGGRDFADVIELDWST